MTRRIVRSPITLFSLMLCCVALSLPTTGALAQESDDSSLLSDLKLPKLKVKKRDRATIEQATFKVVKGDGRIYFSLISGDDVLLRSPGYATERAIDEAMAEVKLRIKRLRAMPLRRLETGEHYFIVTTSKDDVLATSPLYASAEEARTMRLRLKDVRVDEEQ